MLKTKISISPLFFAVLTLVLIFDKTGISNFALLFSFLHEMGHFAALLCGKINPENISITIFGIHIRLPGNLSTKKKCVVLVAGFLVNFFLAALFFASGKTVFGYINLLIGIFTSLPIESTDGGEVFKAVLEELLSNKAEKFFRIVSGILSFIFSVVLVFLSVEANNCFILLAVIYMIFCAIKTAVK